MVFNFFKSSTPKKEEEEISIPWELNSKGRFWKLLHIRPHSHQHHNIGGVVAFFHRGVKPAWIYICATDDIGKLLEDAKDEPKIYDYEPKGGVYVTWSPVKASARDGVVASLRQQLKPKEDTTPLDGGKTYDVKPIKVKPPV